MCTGGTGLDSNKALVTIMKPFNIIKKMIVSHQVLNFLKRISISFSHLDRYCCLNNPYIITLTLITVGTVATSKVSSSRPSTISIQENCYHHQPTMSSYSSSIGWGHHHHNMGSSDSEPKEQVTAREEFLKGLGCNDFFETSLSVGQSAVVFGQKLPTTTDHSCGDEGISYKRSKTSMAPLPAVFLKPCSNDRNLTFQSAEFVLGVKPGMEDLDLELRLGKPQKVI